MREWLRANSVNPTFPVYSEISRRAQCGRLRGHRNADFRRNRNQHSRHRADGCCLAPENARCVLNRSRYIIRALDPVDRAILLALAQNARVTVRELAQKIGLSSPSATERMRRLEDTGVIAGYTVAIDNHALGQPIGVHFRLHPITGEVPRIVAMLAETPEMIEADRVTGEHCLVAKAYVADLRDLERLIDRFLPYAATSAAVIQSSPVNRRLPKL